MYQIVNALSFETYILILLFILGGSIFSIFEMRKKRPGNPSVWIFPFAIFMSISLILYRCAIELTTNETFQQATDCIALISIVLFFLSFIVTFIVAYKTSFIDKTKVKKLLPVYIIGIIMIVLGLLMLN